MSHNSNFPNVNNTGFQNFSSDSSASDYDISEGFLPSSTISFTKKLQAGLVHAEFSIINKFGT